MKIGIVCYPSLGGSGILATALGHQLALRGHAVHFITYDVPFALELSEAGIHFHEVEIHPYELFTYPDYNLALAVKILEVSKQEKLDILHVHYAVPHATSAYLAKQLLGTALPKVITTLHGTDITLIGRDPSYFDIVKFSIEESDAVTAVSKSLRDETSRLLGVKREISVIPNFFIPDKKLLYRKPCRDELAPSGEKLLLHISNYRPVKRAQDVVEVFRRVAERLPAKLLLVGAGEGLARVREQVSRLEIEPSVAFLGARKRVDPVIASADLLLLPSEQESFGLVALEAMSYGVPVIASNAGGLPEVIEDGVSGMLFPVGDVQGMADAAVKLLQNRTFRDSISRAARKRASERFCAEKIVPEYENLYRKALG